MIVAERKPLRQILRSVEPYRRVLVVGCGSCVTVSLSGGEKEAALLAHLLDLAGQRQIRNGSCQRQCDMEFLEKLDVDADWADCILSLACGAGVQYMAERFPDKPVVPALNTTFLGVNRDVGHFTEMCLGCGDCTLDRTGGICPVTRCAKGIKNGPCGGSQKGKCELGNGDCAWQLIYDRLARLGKTENLYDIQPPTDWSTSHHGGPRQVNFRALRPEEQQ